MACLRCPPACSQRAASGCIQYPACSFTARAAVVLFHILLVVTVAAQPEIDQRSGRRGLGHLRQLLRGGCSCLLSFPETAAWQLGLAQKLAQTSHVCRMWQCSATWDGARLYTRICTCKVLEDLQRTQQQPTSPGLVNSAAAAADKGMQEHLAGCGWPGAQPTSSRGAGCAACPASLASYFPAPARGSNTPLALQA